MTSALDNGSREASNFSQPMVSLTDPTSGPGAGVFPNPNVRNSLILLGLSILLWLPRLQGPIDLRYDAGVYYILGTSLAEGKGYRLLNEPGDIEVIQYPPLLAAFVAVHQWLLGSSDPAVVGPWLRLSFCLIFILYIQAVYRMALLFLVPAAALIVALITTLYLHSYYLSDLLFTEIPFALVTTLFILANRRSDTPRGFVLAALCGVAAYGLRTAGAALLVAWVAESFLQKRWPQLALRTLVALLPILAWQVYTHHVTSSLAYQHPAYAYQRAPYQNYNIGYVENNLLVDTFKPELGWLSPAGLAERLFRNLAVVVPTSLGEGVTAGTMVWSWLLGHLPLPPWVALLPIQLVGCLVLAGAAVWLVRRQWFFPLFIAASVGLMCLTPWPGQFARYLTPLTPLLALALLQGLEVFRAYFQCRWSVRGQRWGWAALVLVLGLVLGTEVVRTLHAFKYRHDKGAVYAEPGMPRHRLFFYDEKWLAFDTALAWLRRQNRPDAVLVTAAPHWAYLKTGLKAVMAPLEVDTDEAQALMDSVPTQYVLVDELDFMDTVRRYAAPAIQHHRERWRLVYTVPNTNTRVYQRIEAGEPPG
jgi:hypothetical protein